MKELPARLVAYEGIVVPAVPQPDHDLRELARPMIALAVLVVDVAAEVVGLAQHAGGDEVPAGAAAADMIDGGELARHMEGLVVARGGGRHEPDAACQRGERREQRERLEVRDVLRRAPERLHVGLANAGIVGEEHHVELGALGGWRDLGVVLEIDPGIGLRPRVPPGCNMMPGWIEERAEPHLTFSAHSLRRLLFRYARSDCRDYNTLSCNTFYINRACPRRSAMVNRRGN